MIVMRPLTFFLVAMTLGSLLACGGGSHGSSPAFTSVPGIAAAQGAVYTYQLAATDPSGGTVTFSLAAAPSGATLAGSTLTWTPTASQSRVPNNFAVTATSSSGTSATQSWTVTPTGIITVTQIDTYWTPSGPQPVPGPESPPSALVPQPDGSVDLLSGTVVSPGVYNIAGVPAGYYWLAFGSLSYSVEGFWTSSSAVDLGRDIGGAPIGVTGSSETTTFDFNLSGLDPSTPPGVVGFIPDNLVPSFPLNLEPQAGSTTLNTSVKLSGDTDFTTMNTAFLMQYEPASLSSSDNVVLDNLVLGPELTLSNLALTNGGTNSITGTLASSPQASVTLSIPGAQWAPLFNNIGPGPFEPTVAGSWLSVAAEPYVIGVNANSVPTAPNLFLVQSNPGNNVPLPLASCPGVPLYVYSVPPVVLTNQNFGTLQYGDPFPSTWARALAFCEQATVSISVSSGFLTFPLNYGEAVVPSNSPLAPLAWPVQNPTINGASLFTAATIDSTVMTLNWSPTGLASPYGYTIYALQVFQNGGEYELAYAGVFGTAQIPVTLPPLPPDNTYLFVIATDVDGIANMESSPYRSQLPTSVATVVSAPITIPAGAPAVRLRGDPKQWQRFLHPEGERHRMPGGHN